ncbi:MAG TPA: hypothetical protein ENH33_02605 [Actinobacteria bacterium]|nr:hypothetical protein [Actinomycetota bacterium]
MKVAGRRRNRENVDWCVWRVHRLVEEGSVIRCTRCGEVWDPSVRRSDGSPSRTVTAPDPWETVGDAV